MENQSRQYGGMGFDNPVYHHNAPHFTDPWTAHTSSHSNPPMYATSMGSGQLPLNPVKQEEVNRPSPMSMSYSSLPVSAPSLVAGNGYSTTSYPSPEVMGMQHEMPRTSFDQAPTYTAASSMGNFAPASYPMGYAPSIQQQDNRRMSHAYVDLHRESRKRH